MYQYCTAENRRGNKIQNLKELMEKVEKSGKHFLDRMLVFSITLLTIVKFIYFKLKKQLEPRYNTEFTKQ